MEIAERIITPIVDPLSTTAIVLIVTVFVLLQREDLRDRLIRLFGSSDLHRTTAAMNDAARRLSRYFLIQLAINTAFGVITGTGLFLIGVPSPLLWGMLGLLLRFVPYIGAPLAAVLPLALAAAVQPGWSMVLWTAGLYGGDRGDHGPGGRAAAVRPQHRPVAVLGRGFGDVLDLAVGADRPDPVDAADAVPGGARPARGAAGVPRRHTGRPARLDPGGKLLPAHAGRRSGRGAGPGRDLLRDRALSSYYDEVALKGLQLAANDAARGVLTEAQLERSRLSMQSLIDDLDEHDDQEPETKGATEGAAASPSRSEQDVPAHPPPGKVVPDALPPAWRGPHAGAVHRRPRAAGRSGGQHAGAITA